MTVEMYISCPSLHLWCTEVAFCALYFFVVGYVRLRLIHCNHGLVFPLGNLSMVREG